MQWLYYITRVCLQVQEWADHILGWLHCRVKRRGGGANVNSRQEWFLSNVLLQKELCTVVAWTGCLYQSRLQGKLQGSYYVSQFTVETYCFADGRCLFKQPQSVIYHWNQYDEEISKKCRFVRLSVCNAKKKAHSSFIIDSRKIIRISDERVWHPLQENEAIFSEK